MQVHCSHAHVGKHQVLWHHRWGWYIICTCTVYFTYVCRRGEYNALWVSRPQMLLHNTIGERALQPLDTDEHCLLRPCTTYLGQEVSQGISRTPPRLSHKLHVPLTYIQGDPGLKQVSGSSTHQINCTKRYEWVLHEEVVWDHWDWRLHFICSLQASLARLMWNTSAIDKLIFLWQSANPISLTMTRLPFHDLVFRHHYLVSFI